MTPPAGRRVPAVSVWNALVRVGRAVRFEAGEPLLTHGSGGDHCFAISSGEVLVTATSRQGATVVIARRGAGDVIGELGALTGLPRTATATASTAVEALRLSASEFEAVLLADPVLAVSEIRRLAGQLRDLTERYSTRSEEVRARLVQLLETHAAATGDPTFRSTREELAGWVGATREAVIRSLRELEAAGVVRLGRGSVELLAPPG